MIHDKKQGYRYQASKNRSSEQDIEQKFKVINALREYGMYALTDMIYLRDRKTSEVRIENDFEITITPDIHERYAVRRPDLYIRKGNIILEIDGSVHGEPGFETDNTLTRNTEYELGGHTIENGKLIILQVADLNNLESVLKAKLTL